MIFQKRKQPEYPTFFFLPIAEIPIKILYKNIATRILLLCTIRDVRSNIHTFLLLSFNIIFSVQFLQYHTYPKSSYNTSTGLYKLQGKICNANVNIFTRQ